MNNNGNSDPSVEQSNPILCLFNVAAATLLILIPLLFLTLKLLFKVNRQIPLASLKGPVMVIVLAPAIMQLLNFG